MAEMRSRGPLAVSTIRCSCAEFAFDEIQVSKEFAEKRGALISVNPQELISANLRQ